jgi:glycosyltransferase involved in cell wall biosynthesis
MKSREILAFYASSNYFSGQKLAFEFALSGLEKRGFKIVRIKLPCIERSTKFSFVEHKLHILKISILLILVWIRSLTLMPGRKVFTCLGQTPISMLREGFPILLNSYLNTADKAVIATHGSNLMKWTSSSLEFNIFQQIVSHAKFVSVLGPNQKAKLQELGILPEKIAVVDNTSDQKLISIDLLRAKHDSLRGTSTNRPKTKVLFLSSLIEEKGYLLFLDAIKLLAEKESVELEVFLCGKLTLSSGRYTKFKEIAEAEAWLVNILSEINYSNNIKIKWVNGIQGLEKEQMYYSAHIFVLPTQYLTEAQPLVLLEALASGCAIITTDIGEIGSTLSSETALFLSEISPVSIADSICKLVEDHQLRLELATNGHDLFQNRFSYEKYIDRWEELIGS